MVWAITGVVLSAAACGWTGSSSSGTSDRVVVDGELHVRAGADPDGDGSPDAPFATLTAGLEALGPGDTLVVHGGEYREQVDLREPAQGTADRPIRVGAAPGDRPVVVGLLWLHDLEHWTVDGISVTWDPDRNESDQHMVKLDGGRHWVFENSEIWGARSYAGILVAGEPVDFTLRRLHVHDTRPTNDRNEDHLVYLNSGTGGGVVEHSLLVGSPNGRAVKVGGASPDGPAVANIVIRHNTMVDNRGPSNVQLAWNTSNVTIERNIMVGADDRRANVTTFELAGSGNVVRDNVGWDAIGLLEPAPGLEDGGLNRVMDPRLEGPTFAPANDEAASHGHLAPSEPDRG